MESITAPAAPPPKKRRRKGWLIALVLISGCTGFVAVPNLLTAMQRSKQKRTMADIRTLATALEARATDTNEYPSSRPVAELGPLLVPKYVKQLPLLDGWGHALRYDGNKEAYTISSAGRDGRFQAYKTGATTNFDCDIVYSNGSFVQYPEAG